MFQISEICKRTKCKRTRVVKWSKIRQQVKTTLFPGVETIHSGCPLLVKAKEQTKCDLWVVQVIKIPNTTHSFMVNQRIFPQKGPKANNSFSKVEVTTVTNSSTALDGFHSSQPLI